MRPVGQRSLSGIDGPELDRHRSRCGYCKPPERSAFDRETASTGAKGGPFHHEGRTRASRWR